MRISAPGAAQLTNAMKARYRSGGPGTESGVSPVLSTASATETLLGNGRRCVRAASRRRVPVETVADSPDRDDLERRASLELFAQPANVHIHRLAVAVELVPPYVLQQNVSRVHSCGEREQVREELELPGGDLDLVVTEQHTPRGPIDAERADRIVFGDGFGLIGLRLRPP